MSSYYLDHGLINNFLEALYYYIPYVHKILKLKYFILNALLHSFEYVFTYVYSTYISNTHMHKYIQVNFLQDEKTKNY